MKQDLSSENSDSFELLLEDQAIARLKILEDLADELMKLLEEFVKEEGNLAVFERAKYQGLMEVEPE